MKLSLVFEGESLPVSPNSGEFTKGETAHVQLSLSKGVFGDGRNGVRFVGWAGDATGLATNFDVLMDRDKTLVAQVEKAPLASIFSTC